MKSLITILSLLCISISSLAGIEVRNGGGGWTSDGQYMTFYSAKIPAQRKPLDPSQVPGLNYLVAKVFSLKITEAVRAEILKSIFPVSNRSYYTTNSSQFDENSKKDLRKKYAGIMGINEENIAVFATTNPMHNETILLPDFYKLTESEQAAILFHESLWILNPLLNYVNIITAEQAAQAYFENANVGENVHAFYYQLSLLMEDRTIPLIAALQFDRNQGFFPSNINKNSSPLESVFGREFLKCLADSENLSYQIPLIPSFQTACSQMLFTSTIKYSMKYPSSIFYKSLLDYLKSGGNISYSPEAPFRISDFSSQKVFLNLTPKEGEVSGLSFTVVNSYDEVLGRLTFN